tara:strand:+ start:3267 stop:3965 length:699 start_codon:yes stop_codon:yes gene_type:complete
MPILEAAALSAAKMAATAVANKAQGVAQDEAVQRTGLGNFMEKKKNWFRDRAHTPIPDDEAMIYLKNIVKYIFYENFIKPSSNPKQEQLDTMLDLIAITIDQGTIKSQIGEDNIDKFYNRDYSFFGDAGKKYFINTIMNTYPGIFKSINRSPSPEEQGRSRAAAASNFAQERAAAAVKDNHQAQGRTVLTAPEGGGKTKRKRKTRKGRSKKIKSKKRKYKMKRTKRNILNKI